MKVILTTNHPTSRTAAKYVPCIISGLDMYHVIFGNII